MRISGGTACTIVELHWMTESDLAMHTASGIAVPALCGAWVAPDAPLMAAIDQGATRVQQISCGRCDLLAGTGQAHSP